MLQVTFYLQRHLCQSDSHLKRTTKRRIQCMGKCECGRSERALPCGPLRALTRIIRDNARQGSGQKEGVEVCFGRSGSEGGWDGEKSSPAGKEWRERETRGRRKSGKKIGRATGRGQVGQRRREIVDVGGGSRSDGDPPNRQLKQISPGCGCRAILACVMGCSSIHFGGVLGFAPTTVKSVRLSDWSHSFMKQKPVDLEEI